MDLLQRIEANYNCLKGFLTYGLFHGSHGPSRYTGQDVRLFDSSDGKNNNNSFSDFAPGGKSYTSVCLL